LNGNLPVEHLSILLKSIFGNWTMDLLKAKTTPDVTRMASLLVNQTDYYRNRWPIDTKKASILLE
jgi:hypothetical protein